MVLIIIGKYDLKLPLKSANVLCMLENPQFFTLILVPSTLIFENVERKEMNLISPETFSWL